MAKFRSVNACYVKKIYKFVRLKDNECVNEIYWSTY